jgi:hypothetical protein
MFELGLPRPELQVPFRDRRGFIGILEKNRENRLRATGAAVTRWDWPTASSPERLLDALTIAGLPTSRRTPKR